MYTVKQEILQSVLRKNFNSFVGNSCETIENLSNENIDKKLISKLIKDSVKKYAYNSMRNIEEQISAFSEGVNINVNLEKPISK